MWFKYRKNFYYFYSEDVKNAYDLFFVEGRVVLSNFLECKIHTSLKKDFFFYNNYKSELIFELDDNFLFKYGIKSRYYFPIYVINKNKFNLVENRDIFSSLMRVFNLFGFYFFFFNFFAIEKNLRFNVLFLDFSLFNLKKFSFLNFLMVKNNVFVKFFNLSRDNGFFSLKSGRSFKKMFNRIFNMILKKKSIFKKRKFLTALFINTSVQFSYFYKNEKKVKRSRFLMYKSANISFLQSSRFKYWIRRLRKQLNRYNFSIFKLRSKVRKFSMRKEKKIKNRQRKTTFKKSRLLFLRKLNYLYLKK